MGVANALSGCLRKAWFLVFWKIWVRTDLHILEESDIVTVRPVLGSLVVAHIVSLPIQGMILGPSMCLRALGSLTAGVEPLRAAELAHINNDILTLGARLRHLPALVFALVRPIGLGRLAGI